MHNKLLLDVVPYKPNLYSLPFIHGWQYSHGQILLHRVKLCGSAGLACPRWLHCRCGVWVVTTGRLHLARMQMTGSLSMCMVSELLLDHMARLAPRHEQALKVRTLNPPGLPNMYAQNQHCIDSAALQRQNWAVGPIQIWRGRAHTGHEFWETWLVSKDEPPHHYEHKGKIPNKTVPTAPSTIKEM